MASNCSLCGVSMTVAEKPGHRGGVVAPYHNVCSEMDYLWSVVDASPMPGWKVELAKMRQKLIDKQNGLTVQWP